MVHIRENRIGLRSAGKSKSAVIAADAAGVVLREIRIVNHEDGKRVGQNGRSVLHDGLDLRVEIVDVHLGGKMSEGRSGGPATLGRSQCYLGLQCGAAQEHMVSSMCGHGAPKVGALVSVNILGGAHVHAAGGEVHS